MAPFITLDFLYEYSLEVEYVWVDCAATDMNMFKNRSKISLQYSILFQRN